MLAGGSLRCASCAASTSPVRASATSQDRAETVGTPGAPARGRTCVPGLSSGDGRDATVPSSPSGTPGSAAAGASAGRNAAQSAQVDTAARRSNPTVMPQT
ncbi:hypothetical protein GCM10010129_60310 [Streptomyces fumigatiscleroticus]|nr:hypothetical protein GCM10010129_60310 [Streptomyces fumigatiscleroticus]